MTSRAATIVAQFDPWSDEKGYPAAGRNLGLQFETGDTDQGFADSRHFPDESATSANSYDVMLDMPGKVLSLDQLAATTPATEIIVVTDCGVNVHGAAIVLRDEVRARGFPSERASCNYHKLNLITGACIDSMA